MKETIRRLLEAEQAGRQAAEQLEQAGEEMLRQARTASEEIARQGRLDADREIEELQARVRAQTQADRLAIQQEAEADVEQMRSLAAVRRAEAVARVVAILLGETDP